MRSLAVACLVSLSVAAAFRSPVHLGRPRLAALSRIQPVSRAPLVRLAVNEGVLEPVAEAAAAPPPPPPPLALDGETKLQLAILLSTSFAVQMGIGAIIVVLPVFASSIGLGPLGVGLMVALPQLTKLLFNLPVGHLIDVVGRKPPLIAGAILDGIGQFGTAAAATLGGLVPPRLLVGVGSATGGTAVTAYTMDVVGKYPDHSGLLLGAVQAFGFLAFAAGPAVGGRLAESGGGPALPFVLLGVVLLLTAPLKALLPETVPEQTRGAAGGLLQAMGGVADSYRRLLADANQLALLCLKCSFLCGLALILTVVPLQASAAWGATAAELGRLQSFVTFLSLLLSPLSGALADRVGRKPLAVGGALASAVGVAATPFATGRGAYYLARALWASGEAFLITAYTALALDVTPEEQRGARSSLDNQVGDFALLLLPVIFGVLGQVASHAAAFWLASAFMLIATATFAKLAKPP